MKKRFKVTIYVESDQHDADKIAEDIVWHYASIKSRNDECCWLDIPDDNIKVETE